MCCPWMAFGLSLCPRNDHLYHVLHPFNILFATSLLSTPPWWGDGGGGVSGGGEAIFALQPTCPATE